MFNCAWIVIYVILFYSNYLMLKKARSAEKQITSPVVGVTYRETYCTLTLDVMRATKLLCVLNCMLIGFEIFLLVIGDKYQDWVETDAFKSCAPSNPLITYSFVMIIYQVLIQLKILVVHIILAFQI